MTSLALVINASTVWSLSIQSKRENIHTIWPETWGLAFSVAGKPAKNTMLRLSGAHTPTQPGAGLHLGRSSNFSIVLEGGPYPPSGSCATDLSTLTSFPNPSPLASLLD